MPASTALAVVWIVLAGSALHFVFGWTDRSVAVAPLAPVNESVWEHGKLAFWPALAFVALDPRRRRTSKAVAWVATVAASLVGPVVVVCGFYAYTTFVPHGLVGDILLFVVAVTIGQLTAARIYRRSWLPTTIVALATVLLAAFIAVQTVWTFRPPQMPVFRDGVTGRYGV